MKLKHFPKTVKGIVRPANEDSIGELLFNKSKYGNIYIVCDGMGGHVGGKKASETAINSIIEYFSNTPSDSPTTALKEAIEFANIQIFGQAQTDSQFKGMGTTCCVLLEKNNLIYVAHVGDSRIYISSDNKFHRITKDHSFVQGLFDNGQISEEEMEIHARKNELTQALGVSAEVNVEVCNDPILAKKGDSFLICSDGLCGLIDDNKIYDIVNKGKTNSEIGNNLIDAANNAGGTDNISVIYITIDESPHASSQFVSKNNIPNDNLTQTMLLDTDQRADILSKKNSSFLNKNKNKIFISVGVLLISLLLLLIITNVVNKDNPENKTADEPTFLVPENENETQIIIDGEKVDIFYYLFKKDTAWTREKKFSPLVDKVKENHIMNNDIQEFFWNKKFLNYNEYKEKENDLYEDDIFDDSFIFIRIDDLEEKPKSSEDLSSVDYGDAFDEKQKQEKIRKEKERKARADQKAKRERKARAEKKAENEKNAQKERNELDLVNQKLKSYAITIIGLRDQINDLNLNDEKIAKLFNEANTNYNDQKSEFFEVYEGYDPEIPTLLPNINIPKNILELSEIFHSKSQELNVISVKADKNFSNAEKTQNKAAEYLNSSKQTFKLVDNLKNEFKLVYNKDNKVLKDRCESDLSKIDRASKNIDIIKIKSDLINDEFKSIKQYLNKINELSEKSDFLKRLIKENVKSKQEKKRGKK